MNEEQQNYSVINLNKTTDEKGNDARMLVRLGDGRILTSDMAGKLWLSSDNLLTMRSVDTEGIYIAACLDNQNRLWLGSRKHGITVDGNDYSDGRTD